MPNPNSLANLGNILAELYPDDAIMQLVATDAGLNTSVIAFGSSVINNWQAILAEAQRSNQIDALLTVVLDQCPANSNLLQKLRQAASAYYASREQGSASDSTSSLVTSNDIKINGGPDIGRDVSTGGDFIVRDKTTQGDEIGGDKAGHDITKVTADNVVIYQYPEAKASLLPARYGWQWGAVIVALLVIIVGIMLWAIYHSSSLSTTPQSTPTAGQGVAFADTHTPLSTIIPTNTVQSLTATSSTQVWTFLTNPKDDAVYVWIPPGEFMMGSSITDTLVYTNERPQHKVVLDGFWIMQTEVTNAQYKRCVEATVCLTPNNSQWADRTYAKHPVVDISWDDAETYANWVDGRLPTEAEWEYACRGTDEQIYSWGNHRPNTQLLNYLGSEKNDTVPVGSYPPGANGLYDMAGNVWEWTADWYGADYYAHSPEQKPQGPASGLYRTFRGGSFRNYDYDIRCAVRLDDDPNFRDNHVGFRVASDGF